MYAPEFCLSSREFLYDAVDAQKHYSRNSCESSYVR
jgi:hypothetical protein